LNGPLPGADTAAVELVTVEPGLDPQAEMDLGLSSFAISRAGSADQGRFMARQCGSTFGQQPHMVSLLQESALSSANTRSSTDVAIWPSAASGPCKPGLPEVVLALVWVASLRNRRVEGRML